MKARPMRYNAEMILAKLAKRKRETRRIMRPQPSRNLIRCDGNNNFWREPSYHSVLWKCPHGVVGDQLWSQENFHIDRHLTIGPHGLQVRLNGFYPADKSPFEVLLDARESALFLKWQRKTGTIPAMYQFRSLSRFLDEITNIRAQRVQEITEAEAIAEGVRQEPDGRWHNYAKGGTSFESPQSSYWSLWDSINAKRKGGFSFADNGWVFAITYKPVEA